MQPEKTVRHSLSQTKPTQEALYGKKANRETLSEKKANASPLPKKKTIRDILSQREAFLVIGLTGRMGSGCSKVAELLATSYDQMKFPHPNPYAGERGRSEDERILRILAEYADEHWVKFDVIHASAVIATFILDDDRQFFQDLSKEAPLRSQNALRSAFQEHILERIYREIVDLGIKLGLLDSNDPAYLGEDAQHPHWKLGKLDAEDKQEKIRSRLCKLAESLSICLDDPEEDSRRRLQQIRGAVTGGTQWDEIRKIINGLYRDDRIQRPGVNRRKYLELVDELLTVFSYRRMVEIFSQLQEDPDPAERLWTQLVAINKSISVKDSTSNTGRQKPQVGDLQIEKYIFVRFVTSWFREAVHDYMTRKSSDDAYARLFQRYGQMIRYNGHISCEPKAVGTASDEKRDIFAIPRRINQHIKVLRHPVDSQRHRPVRIVVDSIKNIFEAVYLRYRYSAFYLWAITTDREIRLNRLHDEHLNDVQIKKLEWNEYPDRGSRVIKGIDRYLAERISLEKGQDAKPEKMPLPQINSLLALYSTDSDKRAEAEFYLDRIMQEKAATPEAQLPAEPELSDPAPEAMDAFNQIRVNFYLDGTYVFYTQDIDSCVSNADVYLFNNAKDTTDTENNQRLLQAVVRNVALVMYPGLVRPSPVERCMQIALSAKVNSGCLSRQVGAVVTDSQYNILAIGWNDVPCGEVSCVYKNLDDINIQADQDAYSDYELHNRDFRSRVAAEIMMRSGTHRQGLPNSYCFKDIHKKEKDPMRSRAMHAEEKALALCGREAEGGYLFTTSSPCEMCSKNAKNHKIKKIYYLEAYPGISQEQYTNSGDKENRAELILFSGAVGRAYMQMYTPLLPHKDVLSYLGQ